MAPTIKTMFWLPHCSTCQKAEAWLTTQGIPIEQTHDLKATPLSEDALKQLVKGIGGADNLFSKRAMKYRSMGLNEQTLSDEQLFEHMLAEYTFIKRPALLLSDGRVLAGFSTKQYKTVFE